MKTTILIYTPGADRPEKREVEIAPGSFESIRAVVEPLVAREKPRTHMEHVSVLFDGQRRDMFVDEMGNVPGMALPVNEAATLIYWASSMARSKMTVDQMRAIGSAPICGPAVVFPFLIVWR